MIVADTCIWIEFLKKHEPYYSVFADMLENSRVLGIECIFGELLQGAKNKREIQIIGEDWHLVPKFSMEGLFIEAGKQSRLGNWHTRGVGLIDSVILIFARTTGSSIWTIDTKLLALMKSEEMFKPE
jgi:hypothetical protein